MELFFANFKLKNFQIKFGLIIFVFYAAILLIGQFLSPYFVTIFAGLGAGVMSKALVPLASYSSAACIMAPFLVLARKSPLKDFLRRSDEPLPDTEKDVRE
jgi:membrane protein implicated in regulation of membrane protease activity